MQSVESRVAFPESSKLPRLDLKQNASAGPYYYCYWQKIMKQ